MPNPRDGEHVFGVAHIFASFNDTFVVGFLLYFRVFQKVMTTGDSSRNVLGQLVLAKKAMINGGAGERLGRIAKILGQIALGLGIFFTIFIGIIVAFAIAGVI